MRRSSFPSRSCASPSVTKSPSLRASGARSAAAPAGDPTCDLGRRRLIVDALGVAHEQAARRRLAASTVYGPRAGRPA